MPPNYPQQQAPTPQTNYDFIVNPPQAPKKSLIPAGGSALSRAAVLGVGLIALLFVLIIIKNLVIKGPNYSSYVTVAQDQQAILHTISGVTATSQQQNLSINNQNLVATAQLSLASNQSQVLSYLSGNGQKVNSKRLVLKINSQYDTDLSNAATAGTYDQTFQSIFQTELKAYTADLSTAYKANTGPRGDAMLKDLYRQASLLDSQVASVD